MVGGKGEKPGEPHGNGTVGIPDRRKNVHHKERGGGKNAQASRETGNRPQDNQKEQHDTHLQRSGHRDKGLQHMLQKIQDPFPF